MEKQNKMCSQNDTRRRTDLRQHIGLCASCTKFRLARRGCAAVSPTAATLRAFRPVAVPSPPCPSGPSATTATARCERARAPTRRRRVHFRMRPVASRDVDDASARGGGDATTHSRFFADTAHHNNIHNTRIEL